MAYSIIFETMQHIRVSIVNRSGNPLPTYATEGSAGMDLRAWLENPVVMNPGERILVPTGLYIELPHGYEAQIRPRSGMAIKQGITCLNTPGTIDSDYRGEIRIILINHDKVAHTIQSGDRIAQMVISQTERAAWLEVKELDETGRGEGGFGHTGKQ